MYCQVEKYFGSTTKECVRFLATINISMYSVPLHVASRFDRSLEIKLL